MANDIKIWVRQCESCERSKPGPGKGKSYLKQIKPQRPMEILAVEKEGPLILTNQKHEYIIVRGWVLLY
jgi:hypothetical protein